MMNVDDTLAQILRDWPARELPPGLASRTLAIARASLAPPLRAAGVPQLRAVMAHATTAALVSADAVFLADAVVKMGRM
jgi:hypothetical protein